MSTVSVTDIGHLLGIVAPWFQWPSRAAMV